MQLLLPCVQFPDVCFGGAPGLEAADQLPNYFPTMDLHFSGGVSLRAGPLNYLFVHAVEVRLQCQQQPDNDVPRAEASANRMTCQPAGNGQHLASSNTDVLTHAFTWSCLRQEAVEGCHD